MKLRNMNAYVIEEKNITIELANGEILNLENALVLHSYASRHVGRVYAVGARL